VHRSDKNVETMWRILVILNEFPQDQQVSSSPYVDLLTRLL
jgi:hypothetical protein